ncbi:hypothetical protein HY312_02250 [Candidatus Saccharibacteria bacterium]|nr:hypothetical protein [Candidatus Saccharibacteria bacterium]
MTSNQTISEAIATLEILDILAIDKAGILLVFAGLKPTALVVLESDIWANGETEKQIDQKVWLNLQFILDRLAIKYATHTNSMGAQKRMRIMNVYIAKETTLVREVALAHRHGDERLLGELFGYPPTSVQAFLDDDCIDPLELPESTTAVTSEDMKFLNHRLSKKNWENEISYLPTYAAQVRQLSPAIYARRLL